MCSVATLRQYDRHVESSSACFKQTKTPRRPDRNAVTANPFKTSTTRFLMSTGKKNFPTNDRTVLCLLIQVDSMSMTADPATLVNINLDALLQARQTLRRGSANNPSHNEKHRTCDACVCSVRLSASCTFSRGPQHSCKRPQRQNCSKSLVEVTS